MTRDTVVGDDFDTGAAGVSTTTTSSSSSDDDDIRCGDDRPCARDVAATASASASTSSADVGDGDAAGAEEALTLAAATLDTGTRMPRWVC